MSNTENDEQFLSFMMVLNKLEGEEYHSDSRSYSDHNTSSMGRVRDPPSEGGSQMVERKFVWDDMQVESFSSIIERVSTCSIEHEEEQHSNITNETERAYSIREKIRQMKDEHDLKSEQLSQLKTVLARKKAAGERRFKVIQDEWKMRFDAQRNEHDQKVIELNSLIEKNNSIISDYEQKKKSMEADLLKVEQIRSTLIAALEEKGRKEILALQQRWKNHERKRLTQLTKTKTSELKKEAAKALEPELRRIFLEHKEDLQRKREEIEIDIKTVGEEMNVHYEEQYAVKRRNLETEERHILQRIDDEYEHKIKLLRVEHEERVVETQSQIEHDFKKAKALQLSQIQREEEIIQAKVSKLRSQNKKKVDETKLAMEFRLEQMKREADEEINKLVQTQEVELQKWQSLDLIEIEKEFANLKLKESEKAQLKAEDEVKMIETKLKSELEEKKKRIANKHEAKVSVLKNSLEKEIDNIIKHGERLGIEHEELQKEKETLTKELDELKLKLESINDKVKDTEVTLEDESHQLKHYQKKVTENERIKRSKTTTALNEKALSIEALKDEIKILEMDINALCIKQQDEKQNLLKSQKTETEKADEKIKIIFMKKEQYINHKQEELCQMKEKMHALDFQLAVARKDQILVTKIDETI